MTDRPTDSEWWQGAAGTAETLYDQMQGVAIAVDDYLRPIDPDDAELQVLRQVLEERRANALAELKEAMPKLVDQAGAVATAVNRLHELILGNG